MPQIATSLVVGETGSMGSIEKRERRDDDGG